ncbi:Disease resistance protein [Nymphaea thermarum]|nr:Disease resistance protein [Nymphaea thermarum]
MAQGFVASRSDQDIELTAEGYFNDLVGRSLIEHRGYDQVFGMHGVIHDLAMYVGRTEYGLDLANQQIRHLSLTNKVHEHSLDPSRLQVPELLRTLFCPLDYLESLPLEKVFNSLKRLRVLDLRGSSVKVLPEAIWELPILKYLNLSHTKVEELPASVGRLHSLQTLNLDYSKIKRIRKEISRLFNLRHLELRGTSHLEFMAEGLGKLTGLRTLDKFIVSDGNDQDGACNLMELKNLNRLRGRLVIEHMERVKDEYYATKAQLHRKNNLTNLKFEYDRQMDVTERKKVEAVLEKLTPPTYLECMELNGYVGRMLPLSWLANNSSLRVLRLEHCMSLETLPTLPVTLTDLDLSYCSELVAIPPTAPSLKSLSISFCPHISLLPFFPSIETIEVASLDSWEGWASGRTTSGETVASMPCLQKLKILNCQRLKHLPPPVFPCLEYLSIKGCVQLHVLWEDEQDPNSSQKEAIDLPRLKFLKLGELQELSALAKGTTSLPMLEELRIELCPRLTWLPEGLMQDLPKLTTLLLLDLEELACLAQGTIKLPKLERLWVGGCPKLTSQQVDMLLRNHTQLTHLWLKKLERLRKLSALVRGDASFLKLEEMRIELCPMLSSLPDGLLKILPKLRKLELLQLYQMTSLYEQGAVSLPKLESLWVIGCPNLSSRQLGRLTQDLPQLTSLFLGWLSWLRSLPQQITNLPKLETLEISHCPNLVSVPDGLTRRLGSGLEISNCQVQCPAQAPATDDQAIRKQDMVSVLGV